MTNVTFSLTELGGGATVMSLALGGLLLHLRHKSDAVTLLVTELERMRGEPAIEAIINRIKGKQANPAGRVIDRHVRRMNGLVSTLRNAPPDD